MISRVFELLVAVACGAGIGCLIGSAGWVFGGALLGALCSGLWDVWRARRVLAWLDAPRVGEAPDLMGVWGGAVGRVCKLIRGLEKKALSSDARLEHFLAAIENSPNGVVLLDATERIEWSNLTAAAHLGFEPERDVGQYVRNLVRAPAFVSYLNGADFSNEIQIDGVGTALGQPLKISLQIHPYGKERKLMLTRDVTAVQLAENMRRDFVANVSHEIRTPLTVLSGFVQTMQGVAMDKSQHDRYLTLMAQQAQRMQTLVSDLLTLCALEGGAALGQGQWVGADALLAQALEEAKALSQVIAQPPHRIEQVGEADFEIAGAKTELLSAMSNLLSNAVRYAPGGSLIQLGWRWREDGGGVAFFVSDTGPGIASEHLPRLTERFYRVDRSRSRQTGGTGLGLAIVKHVAQRHGGQLEVRSVLGQGSTFVMLLPASRVRTKQGLLR